MKLKNLSAYNFRNIAKLNIDCSDGINLFIGDNAQGKTNILEAIYILGNIRSFRNTINQNSIRIGFKESRILGIVEKNSLIFELSILMSYGQKNRYHVDDKQIKKAIDYIGKINSMIIAPEDLLLVKGDGQARRRFMDIALCQGNYAYISALVNLNKCIKQRNFLIKHIQGNINGYREITPWEEQIIDNSEIIVQNRIDFIKKIAFLVNKFHNKLSSEKEYINVTYIPGLIDNKEINSGKEYRNHLRHLFENKRGLEIKRGATLFGPHRDDINFDINNNSAKAYASQGQQRSLVVSIKLAEWSFLCDRLGHSPILLVDDIFAELDNHRRTLLFEQFKEGTQMFITGTRLEDFPGLQKRAKIWRITSGEAVHVRC